MTDEWRRVVGLALLLVLCAFGVVETSDSDSFVWRALNWIAVVGIAVLIVVDLVTILRQRNRGRDGLNS